MEKQTLVLYPVPLIGHLISMVELGKLIIKYHPSLTITVLITTAPFNTGSTAPYIDRVSKTFPSIHFHHLPTLTSPLNSSNSPHFEASAFELLRLNNPLVHQALQAISKTSTIKALIIDYFGAVVLDVANDLNIPTFNFFTSNAATLALFLHFPTLHKTKSFKDVDTHLHVPGIPTILASDMPDPMIDRDDIAYQGFLNSSTCLSRCKGIIINSFESIEPRALKAIREGLCVPDSPTPPVYTIGPLIADRAQGTLHECLTWLDSQPSRSVVFLCFGSLGLFSEAQLKEIAVGLEKSGQRFLWVVRSPPTEDQTPRFLAPPEPDLDALLSPGFLERTKGRGLVVKSWAPQVEVLNREAVGGFVTHCGWNSVLEAVCEGIPMVAWPLYAEQRMNKVFLVEEMKLALPMVKSDDGFVSAGEVEKRVRQLMESFEGKAVRGQTMRMREDAKAALSEGGSSLKALSELAQTWKQ